jgi:LPS-assembly protein
VAPIATLVLLGSAGTLAQDAPPQPSPDVPAEARPAPSPPKGNPTPAANQAASARPAKADPGPTHLKLRSEKMLGDGRGRTPGPGPIYVHANRLTGDVNEDSTLDGDVEVRRDGVVLRAEHADYTFATDLMHATGNVHLVDRGASFDGPDLKFHLEAHTGEMPNASYSYAAKQGRGDSRLAEFFGDDSVTLHDATYTTCRPNDPSWVIRARTFDIDEGNQEAIGHDATLYFEGLPVFYSPYFDVPLGDSRRSGLLPPGFAASSSLGEEFIFPYYWNIAPNRDYTITPDIIPQHGISLGNEFRFLEPEERGDFVYNIMPQDRKSGSDRYLESATSEFQNFHGLHAYVNYTRVSDDTYLEDFNHNIILASPEELPQQEIITYTREYYNAMIKVDKAQTLVSLLASSDPGPYERVPELQFNTMRGDWYGFDLAGTIDATRFQHPAINPFYVPAATTPPLSNGWYVQDGSRLIVNPSVSYPLLAPGWFITPKVQWNYTSYELDPNYNDGQTSGQRSLPIGSLDTGLVFERPVKWLGEESHQTLEPRVYYAWIPYRTQNQLPNFDSADSDLNFAQLFTENDFTGGDRISKDNQVTTALTTRIINDETGGERLRLALGQKFYFTDEPVALPGDTPRVGRASDTLFLGTVSLGQRWNVDVGLDYSTETNAFELATFGFHWQPKPTSVFNLSYRYLNESITGTGLSVNEVKTSAEWPFGARWYGVGVVEYSIDDRALVQGIAGFEYKADCWVGRFLLGRYAETQPNNPNALSNNYQSVIFFQIELNGLTSVGVNPLDQLKQNITGYQRVNPAPLTGGPFENYQ